MTLSAVAAVLCASPLRTTGQLCRLCRAPPTSPQGSAVGEKSVCAGLQTGSFFFFFFISRATNALLRPLADRVFGDVALSREELSRLAPPATWGGGGGRWRPEELKMATRHLCRGSEVGGPAQCWTDGRTWARIPDECG